MNTASKVQIVTSAPPEACDAIRQAIGEAGAGQLGEYTFCSFSYAGTGRFIPSDQADPHIGRRGELAQVAEERIEVICAREAAPAVLRALRAAHPYEEPAISILPLLNEDEL